MNQHRPTFNRSSTMRQVLVFSLAASLTLPSPALALRQTGLEEQEIEGKPQKYKSELVAALTSFAPTSPVLPGIQAGPPAERPDITTNAGMEEIENLVKSLTEGSFKDRMDALTGLLQNRFSLTYDRHNLSLN